MRTLIFTLLLFITCSLRGQDVFNPYKVPSATTLIPTTNWDIPVNDINANFNPQRDHYNGAAYTGEYQIYLDNRFPWGQYFTSGFSTITVTYQMEVVSFPFTVPCAFQSGGCPPSIVLNRELFMPTITYNPTTRCWGDLSNKLPDDLIIDNGFGGNLQTLISDAFVNRQLHFSTSNAKLLPHTIIKHTICAHCGNSTVHSTIIDSISWYYDNTRGRMRYYPFCTSNCLYNMKAWDIVFHPELLKTDNNYPYDYQLNDLLQFPTLDYFPYNEINNPSPCSLTGTTTPSEHIDKFNTGFYNYNFIYPPSQSLLSCPARTEKGALIAGYDWHTGYLDIDQLQGSLHHYFIDTDFELTDINPIDRIIFNPSDVTITASDLHFPSGYTFKTIRGVYPSLTEVTRDNTGDNGGTYTDLRKVPVITDLRCEDPLFPHDPAILDDAKYSSLYRLASGSKLTIDPCVTVYDAAFILDVGSTLDFANFNSFRGLPRIAIDRNGGRLIKRFVPTTIDQTLYLQNETKTANKPDSYFIEGKIEARKNVDATQPPGNYIVDANAGLELVASEYIAFKDGFSAKANSNLSARIDNSLSIPQCRISNSGNRMALNTNSSQQYAATIQTKNTCNISVYPSIFSTNITVDFPVSTGIKKLVIYDALGKIVYHLKSDNFTSPIELSQLNDGIYFVKIESESCNSFSKTIVKNGGK